LGLCLATGARGAVTLRVTCDPDSVDGTIYDHSSALVNGTIGGKVHFSDYADKVVLFVNTASYDTRTTEQYHLLNELAELYREEAFEIVAHPSQQLGKLEPWVGAEELYNILRHVRPGNGFEPKFPMFNKVDLNGATATGVYTFLRSGCQQTDDLFRTDIEYTDLDAKDVRNPFEKFLVGKDGRTYFRYSERVSAVQDMKDDIDALLMA